ncbi:MULTISPECIES: hypothetical protein [unclassified Bradyrhizobium]|uniref:hypothetical protein n=1 Tax=unclassified Bradyrhizobium TaxID=2631580 RepID=UPI0029171468|nr:MULTISPECIES: hypothetical protein [unclassified Bradyrhizobium]
MDEPRYLGWRALSDLAKYMSGVVPISGYNGCFLAIEGRLTLRAELSLLKKLSAHSTDPGNLPEIKTDAEDLTGDALEEPCPDRSELLTIGRSSSVP